MKLFYKNSREMRVDFAKWPIMYQEPVSLLEKEWQYDYVNHQSYGGKVKRFYRGIEEKILRVSLFAESGQDFKDIIRKMEECFEFDMAVMTAGRLYFGDSYLKCYIKGAKWEEWEEDLYATDQELTILAEYPFWITEKAYVFQVSEITTTDNKKYPYKYVARYANGLINTKVVNEHFLPCHFQLKIYGPCANPHVIIGNHVYQFYNVLEQGEYMTVDSMNKTVKKTMTNGIVVNAFNCRDKQNSVFQKIEPGRNSVKWPRSFDFEITLYEERSGPG